MVDDIAVGLSVLALLFVVAGLLNCKRQKKHVTMMLTAFAIDMVALVLVEVVPIFRHDDVDPISGLAEGSGPWMNYVHATLSTIAVVCYFVQIVNGRKIMAGRRELLPFHGKVAKVFLITRGLAFVTMFMVR